MSIFRYSFTLYTCLYLFLVPATTLCGVLTAQEELLSYRTYLTPHELTLFRDSLEFIRDDNCRRALNATLFGLQNNAQWAVSMYDASVRSAIGTESKVLHQLGHFDQCLQTHLDPAPPATVAAAEWMDYPQPVQVQYCLVDVTLNGITAMDTHAIETVISRWGECVPAACSGDDVAIYLQHTLQRNVTVNDKMCQLTQNHQRPITGGMLIYVCIIAFFLFLAFLSTTYHIYLITIQQNKSSLEKTMKDNEILNMALLSFSVIENTKKLFQASKDQKGLNSLNGIKALAMIFILFGHAATFIYGSPSYNVDFIKEKMTWSIFGYVTNSLLFVDIYLLLSGYLFFRILFVEMERRKGKINPLILYVGRYIRLTPSYMVVIGFYMTWFTSIGNGPIWQERIGLQAERCQASWWLNILYINNYIDSDKLCMFQSWYLSADTQLFFVAPAIMFLIHKSRKYGLSLLAALIAITSVVPFVVTYLQELQPTFMVYSKEAEDVVSSEYYRGTYIKTHMRASAYFFGLLTGYLAHQIQSKRIKLSKFVVRTMWTLGCIMGIGSMFSLGRFYAAPFTNIESTLYGGFHKLAWNLANGWLVLAVTTGHGGWVQRMLSSRVFVPFSRLTYCAYLCNGIVELYHTSCIRSTERIEYIKIGNDMMGHAVDTFTLGLLVCLIFESPVHALERILMRYFFGRATTNKTNSNNSSGDVTPSTSEEQVA